MLLSLSLTRLYWLAEPALVVYKLMYLSQSPIVSLSISPTALIGVGERDGTPYLIISFYIW